MTEESRPRRPRPRLRLGADLLVFLGELLLAGGAGALVRRRHDFAGRAGAGRRSGRDDSGAGQPGDQAGLAGEDDHGGRGQQRVGAADHQPGLQHRRRPDGRGCRGRGPVAGEPGRHRRRGAPAEIAPIWQVDATRAVPTIRPLVAPLEKLAQDAAVRMVGAQVQSVPSAMGQAIDLAAGIAELERRPGSNPGRPPAHPACHPAAPRQVAELGAAAEEARRLLAGGPIAIRLYDPIKDEKLAWQITREEIGGVLALKSNPNAPDAPTWIV